MNKTNILDELVGKTITAINGAEKHQHVIDMTLDTGKIFRFYHEQDCCESVYVEDVCGDIADLIGSPITRAEERISTDPLGRENEYDSYTYTFYEFATIKGSVTIRWVGVSNGYYSESVDMEIIRMTDETAPPPEKPKKYLVTIFRRGSRTQHEYSGVTWYGVEGMVLVVVANDMKACYILDTVDRYSVEEESDD